MIFVVLCDIGLLLVDQDIVWIVQMMCCVVMVGLFLNELCLVWGVVCYLKLQGICVILVNLGYVGDMILDEMVYVDLVLIFKEVEVDMVDIFCCVEVVFVIVDQVLQVLLYLVMIWM